MRMTVIRSAAAASLVLLLAAGCSSNGSDTVQRVAPGAQQSSVSTSADGTDWSMRARNVQLSIKDAVLRVDASGDATLRFTVDNQGPVAEHLAMVSTTAGAGQAVLRGSAGKQNALSTAGILIDSGTTAAFGTGAPSVTLHGVTAKPGGTAPVLLEFGIAGLVHLTVPVKAA